MQCKKDIRTKAPDFNTGGKSTASANTKFNAGSIVMHVEATSTCSRYNNTLYRGYSYAAINVGNITPISNIGRYSKLGVSLSGTKIKRCIRTGSNNNSNTEITTATVIASGDADFSFNSGNIPGNIILCLMCGGTTEDISYDKDISYSYSYSSNITSIYLV